MPDPARPATGFRSPKFRILLPILLAVAALVVFLALFWDHGGRGRKGHGHRGGSAAADRGRSPVGGGELEDLGNDRVTGKGGPAAGGRSQARKGGKGDAWWAPDGKRDREPAEGDAWWAPEKGEKAAAGKESPVGGSRDEAGTASPVGGRVRAENPARPSRANPGEAAGRSGPDDFWWRK